MGGYGQFCPVAKAMELFDERWTMLVVREMLLGSCHFNELRRGVPKMSPALLSKRLKSLVRAGVVERSEDCGRTTYRLTDRGHELAEVVDALGRWGARWIGELGDADLDPHLLMWDIQRSIPVAAWPHTRTALAFRLAGVPSRYSRWWLVVESGEVHVCDVDPGAGTVGTISAGLRDLTRVWRGDVGWQRALGEDVVTFTGPAEVRRAVPSWLGMSRMAAVSRPA
jgi:DNA-binding HxlR family transcriptional regulator